jgi:hypothetical protein
MVVDAGKSQVLERKMTQFFNRLIDADFAVFNLTQ